LINKKKTKEKWEEKIKRKEKDIPGMCGGEKDSEEVREEKERERNAKEERNTSLVILGILVF